MSKRLVPGWLARIIFTLALLGCGGNAVDRQFTANFAMGDSQQTTTGSFYFKTGSYRMEIEQDGDQIAVIVDQEARKTRIIMPGRREYAEISTWDPMSLMNDPFQGLKYTAAMGERRPEGTETINGYECDKYIVSIDGKDVLASWVARKFDFSLKIEMIVAPNSFMELKNIKEIAVDDAMFQVPDEYTKILRPDEELAEAPEWTKDIPSAPILNPPFQCDLTAGDIVRVRVQSGKSFMAKAVSNTDTEA
ncbi:MAG: DUF4412 domain-containing protein, partial [Candidatus Zixiibacteriota bacterium]